MADSSVGLLDQLSTLSDYSLLVVEHNGEALHITLGQLKAYIEAAAREAAYGLASDGGKLIVSAENYGTALPESAKEGQVFFLLG